MTARAQIDATPPAAIGALADRRRAARPNVCQAPTATVTPARTNAMESVDLADEGGRGLRGALAQFGTGVTVVTADSPIGRVGVTANSFSSVSLSPPLVLWSLARGSRRYARFAAAEHIAIHVLADDQIDVCKAFAKSDDAFDVGEWSVNAEGAPVLGGCLARFECRRYAEHEGGDHAIFVAEVLRAGTRSGGAPLMFQGGGFGGFVSAA